MFDPNNIRAEMARNRVTIEELSSRTGLATSTIAKILGPGGNPTVASVTAIATALGVDEALFFRVEQHRGVIDIQAPTPKAG